jgi:glutamate transport system substrate-binding protein
MPNLDRRTFLISAGSAAALLGLAGCSSDESSTDAAATDDTASVASAIDAEAYDALIESGPVATEEQIDSSEWAKKVKESGVLRIGGVQTSTLFALMNEQDNTIRGFDAGLYQLLAHYIFGDSSKVEVTQVTSDTRESVLQNDQVDAVFATYTITPKRQEVISFAGPYYNSQYSILVAADNDDISGLEDLAGKTVAVQSGSTGPELMEEYAPDAVLEEFTTDEEARSALEQGRVDAYVFDDSMNRGSIVKNPGKYKIVGDLFGPDDPYGIGLELDSDGVAFVNEFLKTIEDDGIWAKLWQLTIGDRTDSTDVPTAPEITTE